jgi:2-dehydropantoate 2-reductase
MNILVCGAGVIGTLYAARLKHAGHRVTVLARGWRLDEVCRDGLVIEDIISGAQLVTPVQTTGRLHPDDSYDLALVIVRKDQLSGIVPDLAGNHRIPAVLFMLNNPLGCAEIAQTLGPDRVLLGFPGAGGIKKGNVIRYALIPQQPTTLGELTGGTSQRLRAIAGAFRKAGFKTTIASNMDAWLKTHALFVTAICGALYLAGANCRRLSEDTVLLGLMSKGIREGFAALSALGIRPTPLPLRVLFTWLPQALVVAYWRRFLRPDMADYVVGGHARAAPGEMRELAADCLILVERSVAGTPALRQLYRAIDAYAAGLDGQSRAG